VLFFGIFLLIFGIFSVGPPLQNFLPMSLVPGPHLALITPSF